MKKIDKNAGKRSIFARAKAWCLAVFSGMALSAPAITGYAAPDENKAQDVSLYESVWYGTVPVVEAGAVTVDNENGGYGFAQLRTKEEIADLSRLVYEGTIQISAGEMDVSCANLIFACQPGGPDNEENRWGHCNFNMGIKLDLKGSCVYVMLAGGSGVWIPMEAVPCALEKGKDIPYKIAFDAESRHVDFQLDGKTLICTDLNAETFGNNPIYEDSLIDSLKPCLAFGSDHSSYTVSGLAVFASDEVFHASPATEDGANVLTALEKEDSAWGGDNYTLDGDTLSILDKTVYGYYRFKQDISELTAFTFKGTLTVNESLGNLACVNIIYLGVPSLTEATRWSGANSHQAIKLDVASGRVYYIACEGSGNWTSSNEEGSELSVPFTFEPGKAYEYVLTYNAGHTTFTLDGKRLLDSDWKCDSTEYMLPQLAFGGAVIDAAVSDLEVLAGEHIPESVSGPADEKPGDETTDGQEPGEGQDPGGEQKPGDGNEIGEGNRTGDGQETENGSDARESGMSVWGIVVSSGIIVILAAAVVCVILSRKRKK